MQSKFMRPKGNIIWEMITDEEGPLYFSFDKKTIYNFWTDYWNLTDEERSIFDKEYPVMAALKNPDVTVPEYDGNDSDSEDEEEYEYSD